MKNNKFFSIIFTLYVCITLLLFILELVFDFGNPLLVIGQAFLVFGLLSIKYFTFSYLITLIGLYVVLYALNIWRIDLYYFRYVVVALFPVVPIFLLFSEWNDKMRIIRKDGLEVEGTYKGVDVYGRPKFEYYLNDKKYISFLYKSGEYSYHKNEKVKVYVSMKEPEKIFAPLPEKQIKMLKGIAIFLSIFALLIIALMLFE